MPTSINILGYDYVLTRTSHKRIPPELLLTNNLSQVLDDKLPRAEGFLGADAPAFSFSTEPLQTLYPLMSLDMLVITRLGAWTCTGRTLGKAHPRKNK